MENIVNEFSLDFPKSYTYGDLLMIPQYTEISSRKNCVVKSKFSRNVPLMIPLVSSCMDTVTEHKMAIGMARSGGIGVIHRYQNICDQVKMIRKVKRAENFIIKEPYIVDENTTIEKLLEIKKDLGIKSFLVTKLPKDRKFSVDIDDEEDLKYFGHSDAFSKKHIDSDYNFKLTGIITKRDLRASKKGHLVKDVMTRREKLDVYTKKKDETLLDIDKITLYDQMVQNRLEKVPIVDTENNIVGLATEKDLYKWINNPISNVDKNGKLYVSAAIGCRDDYMQRAEALVNTGCDALVVDVANGHNKMTIDTVAELKEYFKNRVDIVAGNVCTGEGARKLIEAGADSIRCGIGNGSICITRIVSGSGLPQVNALISVSKACKEFGVPLISDGGNKNSGNMCKALALGADSLMMGRLLAGTDESPGLSFLKEGKFVKIHRGMAGYGANMAKAQRMGKKMPDSIGFTPEGVEGYVNYCGPLKDVLTRFVMGIKSGMSYMGARNIEELRKNAKFTLISSNSFTMSKVHGVKNI